MTYNEFIENILNSRGRFGTPTNEYKERHHIVPKCLGGTNDKDNLIDLYAHEHYEAHRLLAVENPHNNKLTYAWWTMSRCVVVQNNERYVPTPEEYELARIAFAKSMTGENNPMYGKELSPETKQKISKSHKDSESAKRALEKMWEKNRGKSPHNKGKKISEETRQKMIKYRQSDAFKLAVSKKVLQYTKEGIFVCMYKSIVDAANSVNTSPQSISRVLRKERKSCKGYVWMYADGNNEFNYSPIEQRRKVNQFDKNGKFIAKYDSIASAGRAMGKSLSNGTCPSIAACCKGRQKTAYGYIWQYDEDDEQEDDE